MPFVEESLHDMLDVICCEGINSEHLQCWSLNIDRHSVFKLTKTHNCASVIGFTLVQAVMLLQRIHVLVSTNRYP